MELRHLREDRHSRSDHIGQAVVAPPMTPRRFCLVGLVSLHIVKASEAFDDGNLGAARASSTCASAHGYGGASRRGLRSQSARLIAQVRPSGILTTAP